MADTKTSLLPAAATLDGTEVVPGVQSAGNVKILISAIKDYCVGFFALKGAVTGSALTMATAKLLGRNTASTGAIEEITLGTNLSMTGTTLNAAGGGATLSANTFTGAQEVDLAVAATSTDGVVLVTTTAATVGAQKFSPRIRWTGSGWKTTATAAAQAVDFIAEVQPVQGAANPTGKLAFSYQVNAAGYTAGPGFNTSGQIEAIVGTAALPSYTYTGDSTTGLYRGASGWSTFTSSGTAVATVGPAGRLQLPSTGVFEFSVGSLFGATDTGVSRIAAGVVGVGTGAQGSFAGDLKLRNLTSTGRIDHPSYTVATLPAAGAAGGDIFVSDAGGNGPCVCVSNGTAFKRSDNASTTVT